MSERDPNIVEDKRPIQVVSWENGDECRVGCNGVVEIVPYLEDGEMAPVTWLAVYQQRMISDPKEMSAAALAMNADAESQKFIQQRIPARMVTISY